MKRLFLCAGFVLSIALVSISPVLARTDSPGAPAFSAASTGVRGSSPVMAGRFDPAHPPPSQPLTATRSAPSHLTVSAAELRKRRADAVAAMPLLDRTRVPAVRAEPLKGLALTESATSEPVSLLASAEGVDENALTNPYYPSDGAIASNGASIVDAANDEIQVRTISTGSVTGTWTFSSFFAPAFLNSDDSGVIFTDPRLQWDSFDGRWLIVVDALYPASGQSWECVAASLTADPTQPWWVYALNSSVDGSTPTTNISDYPTLGFDTQAVYISTNQFNWLTGVFAYSKLRVFSKLSLESGSAVTWTDFVGMVNADGTAAVALQPAINLTAPSVEYLLSAEPFGGSTLSVWEVVNPLTSPSLYRATIAVSTYYLPVDAAQPGGVQGLDAGDNRMQQVVQRDGILYGALTTSANFGYGVIDIPRLFTIDASLPALLSDDDAGWANVNGFYPSVSVDSAGDVMVVFLCSDSVTYASVCVDTRAGSAPPTAMDQPVGVTPGSYSYVADDVTARNRWGDYSAIALDPNGTTFWTIGEYAAYPFDLWGTRVNALTYEPTTGTTATPTATPTDVPTATPAPGFRIYLPFVVNGTGP